MVLQNYVAVCSCRAEFDTGNNWTLHQRDPYCPIHGDRSELTVTTNAPDGAFYLYHKQDLHGAEDVKLTVGQVATKCPICHGQHIIGQEGQCGKG